jgi:RNA polymerase sigma factor (sigma-70 family)
LKKNKTYDTDEVLAKACARLDERAQRLLYERFVESMYNTAYRYCFDQQLAEDILQVTFTKVFHNIKKYDPAKGSLKAWIRKICINTATDLIKKEVKWESNWDSEWEVIDEKSNFHHLEAEYLLQLIVSLPYEMRTIFNMYEIEGYSHDEIAEMLGINVNSCRVYLPRAKKRLRKEISSLKGLQIESQT